MSPQVMRAKAGIAVMSALVASAFGTAAAVPGHCDAPAAVDVESDAVAILAGCNRTTVFQGSLEVQGDVIIRDGAGTVDLGAAVTAMGQESEQLLTRFENLAAGVDEMARAQQLAEGDIEEIQKLMGDLEALVEETVVRIDPPTAAPTATTTETHYAHLVTLKPDWDLADST